MSQITDWFKLQNASIKNKLVFFITFFLLFLLSYFELAPKIFIYSFIPCLFLFVSIVGDALEWVLMLSKKIIIDRKNKKAKELSKSEFDFFSINYNSFNGTNIDVQVKHVPIMMKLAEKGYIELWRDEAKEILQSYGPGRSRNTQPLVVRLTKEGYELIEKISSSSNSNK